MASGKMKGNPKGYIFDCEPEVIPPGTKRGQRLFPDDEERSKRMWRLMGAVALGAMIVGILIGRLLLP